MQVRKQQLELDMEQQTCFKYPGTPQDEAGLTRKFETSPIGGPTCRKTPISRFTLDNSHLTGSLVGEKEKEKDW